MQGSLTSDIFLTKGDSIPSLEARLPLERKGDRSHGQPGEQLTFHPSITCEPTSLSFAQLLPLPRFQAIPPTTPDWTGVLSFYFSSSCLAYQAETTARPTHKKASHSPEEPHSPVRNSTTAKAIPKQLIREKEEGGLAAEHWRVLSVSGGVKITSQGLTWQEEGSVRKYLVIYKKAGAKDTLGQSPHTPSHSTSRELASLAVPDHPPLALETHLMPRVLGTLWGLRNRATYEWKRQDRGLQPPFFPLYYQR